MTKKWLRLMGLLILTGCEPPKAEDPHDLDQMVMADLDELHLSLESPEDQQEMILTEPLDHNFSEE